MTKAIKFFLGGLFLGISFALSFNLLEEKLENFFYAQIGKPFEEISLVKFSFPKKPPLEIEAESAFSLKIYPSGKEKILFKKNPEEILPIASLTKLMTAIISLENYDLYQEIEVSQRAQNQVDVLNYGNLKKGEVFSQITLLRLMLVYSSNDAAFALAEKMGIEKFVKKMNKKAKELGMENTIFFNPTGLKDGGINLSSIEDLLKLIKYILREKPIILEISRRKLKFEPYHSIFDISLPEGKELLGGKTGFLPASEIGKNRDWGCMVFVFKDEKRFTYINIILGAKGAKERVVQMQKLVDWIFLQ